MHWIGDNIPHHQIYRQNDLTVERMHPMSYQQHLHRDLSHVILSPLLHQYLYIREVVDEYKTPLLHQRKLKITTNISLSPISLFVLASKETSESSVLSDVLIFLLIRTVMLERVIGSLIPQSLKVSQNLLTIRWLLLWATSSSRFRSWILEICTHELVSRTRSPHLRILDSTSR
jgi:hypothetical protein